MVSIEVCPGSSSEGIHTFEPHPEDPTYIFCSQCGVGYDEVFRETHEKGGGEWVIS